MSDAGAPPDNPDGANQGGFALGGAPDATKPYRVLARKYRPSSFEDLIGQEAMVRTVSNAFETGRIPQAWILTGDPASLTGELDAIDKVTPADVARVAATYLVPAKATVVVVPPVSAP